MRFCYVHFDVRNFKRFVRQIFLQLLKLNRKSKFGSWQNRSNFQRNVEKIVEIGLILTVLNQISSIFEPKMCFNYEKKNLQLGEVVGGVVRGLSVGGSKRLALEEF